MENKINYDNLDKTRDRLRKKGVIVINEDFTSLMMERVYFEIYELHHDLNIQKITIYINSRGGNVDALLPLVDIIDNSLVPISTMVLGKAYSAGAMLLLCGRKGFRFAHKNSDILLHEVSNYSCGANSQMQEDAKYTERINKTLIALIKERTKMTDEQINKYMSSNKDIFITAQQALKYGIIDKIV